MSSEPMNAALKYPILPIYSNPADPDSDNDGIIDKLDLQCLKATPITMENIVLSSNGAFVVVKHLSDSERISINSCTSLYSIPAMESSKYSITANTKLIITDVIYSNDEYWFKVCNMTNRVLGYVKCELTNKQPSDFGVVTISNIDILDKLITRAPISYESAAAFSKDISYGSTYSELIKNERIKIRAEKILS